MKSSIFHFAILLVISVRIFPQTSDQDLLRLFQTARPDEVTEKIQTIIDENKGTPLALYLEAIIESDAGKAVEKYKQLLSKFPKSIQAESALTKTAHYYFSRGLYITARKYYLELVEKYPQSSYIDEAMYFAAVCLCAAGKSESCYAELNNFLSQNRDSPLIKLARDDIKALSKKDKFFNSKVDFAYVNGKYTLQIGAFSQVNNALNLKKYFQKLGLPVEIREKKNGNGTMYLVWIGAFESRESAELFGTDFKSEYGKLYRIVER